MNHKMDWSITFNIKQNESFKAFIEEAKKKYDDLTRLEEVMTAHICYCCHLVRSCGQCCKACKNPCGVRHDCCRLYMTENEGWEWYQNVTSVIDIDILKEIIPDVMPPAIERQVKKATRKPIQLKIEFEI